MSQRKTLTWGSKDETYVATAESIAIDAVIAGIKASTGATSIEVRPITYQDLGSSASTDPFINYSASAGSNSILPSNFVVPNGKAFAFIGLRDLTAGTKSLSGLQMVLNGTYYPLQPIPLYQAWVDERNTVFFSPLKATAPNVPLAINLFSTSAQTVSFQLVGFVAQPLSAVSQ